jgi:hypothetical protein
MASFHSTPIPFHVVAHPIADRVTSTYQQKLHVSTYMFGRTKPHHNIYEAALSLTGQHTEVVQDYIYDMETPRTTCLS